MKISVVIPTYKREHTIKTALQSIYGQTYTDWEAVVVDNEPNHTYIFDNPKVKYVQYPEKRGVSAARNKGIKEATGDLICFLDDDDVLHSDYMEQMARPFQNPEVAIVHCLIHLGDIVRAEHECHTPTVMIRKRYVTPTWTNRFDHDQWYYNIVIAAISENKFHDWNDVIHSDSKAFHLIPSVLVRAHHAPDGGLRAAGGIL